MSPESIRNFVRDYAFQRSRTGRSKFKKLLSKFLPRMVQIELARGFRMELDLNIDRQAYIFWHYEEDEAQLLWAIDQFLPVGGNMVDCGANVGFFGLYAMFTRGAHVDFIEPLPRLVQQIKASLALNSYGANGTVHEFAASDQPGTMNLELHSKNDGSHKLVKEISNRSSIKVDVRTLDTIIENKTIDFLKIDAEGYDYQTLIGIGEHLNPSQIPVIYLEDSNKEVHTLLKSKGYTPFQSRKYYIDPLRKKIRSGNLHGFFHPTHQIGVNQLWVEQGSKNEAFLNQVSRYDQA